MRGTMLRTAGSSLSRYLSRRVASAAPLLCNGHPQVHQSGHPVLSSGRWLHSRPAVASGHRSGTHSSCHSSSSLGSDDFGIATGVELEELEAERSGGKRFDLDPPRGPFGTKEAPAIVESHYDVRIVGCSGGVGEDEHDVTWFHLEKGKTYECSVCSQVFQLKVIGEGGLPGHEHDHH